MFDEDGDPLGSRDLHSKKIGVFRGEREVVLMAGTKLKITSLDRVVDPDGSGDEVFEIHAREVRD